MLQKIDYVGWFESLHWQRSAARTVRMVDAIADLVQSQEDQPQTHHCVTQIVRELGIPQSYVHDVIKQDLKFECSTWMS